MYKIEGRIWIKNIANFPKQIFDYIPFIESQIFPTRVIKIYRKTLCPGA